MPNKFISPECEKMAIGLIEAYGHLWFAEARAAEGYIKDTETHVRIALDKLAETGLDKEDLEPIIDPLNDILEKRMVIYHPVTIQSHLDSSQEEIIRLAPNYIAACECSKRRSGA